MADSILGLPSSAKFAAEGDRFYNHRRKILHAYPNGSAPLTGILSMVPEEETNDSIFLWPEKRYQSPWTQLRGTARLTKTAPSTGDADDGTVADATATAITTDLWMKVDSTKDFKIGQVIRNDTDGNLFYVTGVTRGVSSDVALGHLKVRLIRAVTLGTIATNYPDDGKIRVVGSAYGEGQSGRGLAATAFKRPYWVQNTTQIFRDHFDFPGSVLKMGLKYDKTGPYQEKAFDTVTDHMTSIERALLFGKRSTTTRSSFDSDQESLTVRTMSGIIEFLELWDAGSAGLTIDGSTYAPYAFKGQTTSDSDEQKRVIENAAGTITVDKLNAWAERIGRYHTNRSRDKLVLCGSGALIALTKMFRQNSNLQVRYGEKAYGLTIVVLTTPFGDFNILTHPLFNEDPTMSYWMLFLDIWNLKYRPLTDRDTRLLKNRQNNGDDFRRDEYLTEAGLELAMPDSHMLVKNVQNYVES